MNIVSGAVCLFLCLQFRKFIKFGVIKKKKRRLRRWIRCTVINSQQKVELKAETKKAIVKREMQEQESEKCKGQYDIVEQQLLEDNFS